MRHFLLTLMAVVAGMTDARTYDYAYLVLQKTDGSTVQVSTSGIGMSLDGPTATLTVGGESYRVSDLRYMYFTNSETPENVVVIPSIGWATFCSASALDFSGTDGLTAYKATFGTATVSLSAISSAIPANTGIVLQGDEGTYHVPVSASAPALTGNDLSGTTTWLDTDDNYNYYALGQIDENTVAFRLVTSGIPIPACKAYYRTSATDAREYLVFASGDSATGIGSVDKGGATDKAVFDLSGRRIAAGSALAKGIYIQSGKKYVNK